MITLDLVLLMVVFIRRNTLHYYALRVSLFLNVAWFEVLGLFITGHLLI